MQSLFSIKTKANSKFHQKWVAPKGLWLRNANKFFSGDIKNGKDFGLPTSCFS